MEKMEKYLCDRTLTFIRTSSQKAAMILFVAWGLALTHQELPSSSTIKNNPDWLRQFQRDVLRTAERPIFSCPDIPLKSPLKITEEDMEDIKRFIKPAQRKYISICNEYVETHTKINFN